MKKFVLSTLTMLLLSVAVTPGFADDSHNHAQNVLPTNYTAKGEVIAIDKAAGKVKLKHDAVPELEWPAMTMFFPVADKAVLEGITVGNKVEFVFVNLNTGPTITQINPVK